MDDSPLYIDGAQGEGGGQILRSSLALALVTGRAVTIDRIRAGRQKPGLMRQHLAAASAAAAVCDGELTGAVLGSRTLTFAPQPPRPGEYRFSVGTAGSSTLVLQTVLPALLTAEGPSRLILEGGTHNAWAPPFDFLQRAYLPLIERMGPRVEAKLERHGFYPAGGGRFTVNIYPCRALRGFDLLERGEITQRTARVLLANLPEHIARRELDVVAEELKWPPSSLEWEHVKSTGPGNVICLAVACEYVTELFTGFGRVGVRAERVARDVIREARDWLDVGAPVGPHLADQLLLPLGISAWQGAAAGRQECSTFRTGPLTPHATTHIDVLRAFLGIEISVHQPEGDPTCVVRIGPGGTAG